MIDLEKGMLVQHASLGLGKVVAVEPKAVHVFFVGRDSRFAAKLRLPDAGNLLKPAGPDERVWLGGGAAFALDEATGRYGYAESWIPHEEAVARFLEAYPKGFADPSYVGEGKGRNGRPARLRRAAAAWEEELGDGEGERLLAAGDVGKLTAAVAAIEKGSGANQSGADKGSLAVALRAPKVAEPFFTALFGFLSTETPERAGFDALAAAAAAFPGDAGPSWPLVTLLPFLAQPSRHLILRPKLSSQAALRLGFELRFAADPNWITYSTLLRSGAHLLERLREIGAKDLMDVEAFLTVVTTRPASRSAADASDA